MPFAPRGAEKRVFRMRLVPTAALAAIMAFVLAAPAGAETLTATGSLIMKDKYGTSEAWGRTLKLPEGGKVVRVMDGTYGFSILDTKGDAVADFESVGSGQGNGERDRCAGLGGFEEIGTAATPARQGGLVGNGRLPLGNLIGVGEELGGPLHRTGQVLGAGHGVNQRAGVEEDGEPACAEQIVEFSAAGMQPIVMAIVVQGRDWQSRAARNRQDRGANRSVAVVFGREGGNDQIVRVVAAQQKDAHQSFVVREVALRDGGVHEPEVADG